MAWFEDWFNTKYYHILYKDRNFEEAETFINKLIEYLGLPRNSKIIDLACGKGRHSVFLNRMGYEVLGLDLSPQSIDFNRRYEHPENTLPQLRFAVHDMRDEIFPLVSQAKVEAVFNLFTSFGYFDDENDDRKVFHSVAGTLVQNGFFVLDFLNEKWVRNTLEPQSVVTREGIDFCISKKIEGGFIVKDIKFCDKGQDFHYFEKVKLHTLSKIDQYAESFGFERVKVFGDYQLNDFNLETSPRAINLFVKK